MDLKADANTAERGRRFPRRAKASIAIAGILAACLILYFGWHGTATQSDRVSEAWQYAIQDSVDLGHPGLVAVTIKGPPPEFDTSALGTEIPIQSYETGDDTSPIASGFPYSWPGLPVAYVGSIGEPNTRAYIVLREEGSPSAYLSGVVRFGDVTANELGFDQHAPESAYQTVSGDVLNRGPYDLLLVAFLPPEASVVLFESGDGARYWQRPVGGMAFLVLDDLGTGDSIDVQVLNERGEKIGKGTEFAR